MDVDRISSKSEPQGVHKEFAITPTLGTLRLRVVGTNEVVLVPTPSDDPNDPLNWSQARKYYITALVCAIQFLGGFLFSAPAVQIVALAMEFKDPNPKNLSSSISAVAYFISACNLMQGTGNIFWMPVVNKYGRRVVYLSSWLLCLASLVWSVLATSYASELAARIFLGFTAGASECVAPLTMTEIFFLHERGKMMGFVLFSLVSGTSFGLILGGLITINLSWRYIYWIALPFVAVAFILVVFTFPDTYYKRDIYATSTTQSSRERRRNDNEHITNVQMRNPATPSEALPTVNKYQSYWASLKISVKPLTEESIIRMTLRPLLGILLPPILWATVTMGINIGVLVIISSNQALAYTEAYHFSVYKAALCWIAGAIGSAIGIVTGGKLSDLIADYLTVRNDGIREPEMRLPAMIVPGIFGPVALIMYGFGIYYKTNWIVPTLGLGFLCFSVVTSATISTTYTVDAYRPIAGETVVTKMAFKAVVGFVLSCYATKWIARMGYRDAFGSMAGVYVFVFLFGIPLFCYGRKIRHSSMEWRIMRQLRWHQDREMGE